MKTTLIIPDHLMRELKRRAARRGETLSAVVADVIRRGLADAPPQTQKPVRLPAHHLGRAKVDIADRDALYRAMENS
ncbi:MAG: hypothetical protein ACT4O1_01105 [Gemmatimonadota bacterium]